MGKHMENISLAVAFGAGIVSFLSPCVLPLAPVYLASLYGPEIYDAGNRLRLPVMLHAVSFVLGFAAVFVLLGAIAGLTGFAVNPSFAALSRVAGWLLIIFGVFILASTRIAWLNFERRLNPSLGHKTGYVRSFLIGAAFSLGWTPCVAPILGSILALASVRATAWQGAYLLAVYSLGLGVPFLLIGLAFDSLVPLLKRVNRYSGAIHLVSGLLLIGVGILVLTNRQLWLSF